ncbi:MAG: carbohydrate kinase [Bacteroidetes bacterium]|nr:carbohydrate kinase [Bacteroidota bacterium]
MYLLGYDIGSSSVKAALVEAETGKVLARAFHPESEMAILAPQAGWAEQDPEAWWESVCTITRQILAETAIDPTDIKGIGIAYQMHGLVLVDKDQQVLRPSIIWCDSRAVAIGDKAFSQIGEERCLQHMLNSPGNFTASKLRWVKENEPAIFERIHKVMLPGDFIAMRLSGEIRTTVTGLSEGVLWDFKQDDLAHLVLNEYDISPDLIPEVAEQFKSQGSVQKEAAALTGLPVGTEIYYRSGDQPNNALSLGVLDPGAVAATGGTSGVIYGIVDQYKYDLQSRINSFAHINHRQEDPRIGLLLCINGTGIQYAWMKKQVAATGMAYAEMEKLLAEVPVGSDGLRVLPFGNGAERMLNNLNQGARISNLHFTRHTQKHLFRAALEGIAFSFAYGFKVLQELGLKPAIIKVGNDNLFQSETFSTTVAQLLNCPIEIVDTTGAIGAAKASGYGAGIYSSLKEAFAESEKENTFLPGKGQAPYLEAYDSWEKELKHYQDFANLKV